MNVKVSYNVEFNISDEELQGSELYTNLVTDTKRSPNKRMDPVVEAELIGKLIQPVIQKKIEELKRMGIVKQIDLSYTI